VSAVCYFSVSVDVDACASTQVLLFLGLANTHTHTHTNTEKYRCVACWRNTSTHKKDINIFEKASKRATPTTATTPTQPSRLLALWPFHNTSTQSRYPCLSSSIEIGPTYTHFSQPPFPKPIYLDVYRSNLLIHLAIKNKGWFLNHSVS